MLPPDPAMSSHVQYRNVCVDNYLKKKKNKKPKASFPEQLPLERVSYRGELVGWEHGGAALLIKPST